MRLTSITLLIQVETLNEEDRVILLAFRLDLIAGEALRGREGVSCGDHAQGGR